MSVRVTFLGTGDAFGTGGRHQTCFLVAHGGGRLLVDCGASALVAMRQRGVEPNDVGLILLSHLHGDHFGGLPFLLLDAQYVSRRSRPLTVAGPAGVEERLGQLMEVTFPGSSATRWRFPLLHHELEPRRADALDGVVATPFEVRHPSGAPTLALRVEAEDRVLAYSADTEWVPALVEVARGADLFVVEAYSFEAGVPFHLSHQVLVDHAAELGARRILLTHMGPKTLARRAELRFETAEDGMTVDV